MACDLCKETPGWVEAPPVVGEGVNIEYAMMRRCKCNPEKTKEEKPKKNYQSSRKVHKWWND